MVIHSFFTQEKDIIKYENFFIDERKKINIKFSEKSKKLFCKVNSAQNTKDAEQYIGKLILIDKSQLPKLNKEQFYFNDLIKINVYVNKKKIGFVKDVKNHGAGDYLEILSKKKEILVPLNNDHVNYINLEESRIILNSIYHEI